MLYVHVPLCGISAYGNTMQHLVANPTLEAALPVLRQGSYPARAMNVFSMTTRSDGRKTAE
jgi:hypothetical protein